MAAFNALKKGELQQAVSTSTRKLVRLTSDLTGANSDAVKAAASRLRDNWRTVLSTRSNKPSAPGRPPAKRSGALARSIRTAVVDGVRRVGSGLHTSRLLQFGVNAAAKAPTTRGVLNPSGRRQRGSKGRGYKIVIPARPHGNVALEQSVEAMNDVMVSTLQLRVAKGIAV